MSGTPQRLAGSFRDPSGHVFVHEGRILRTVAPSALDAFRQARPTLDRLVAERRLVGFSEVDPGRLGFEPGFAGLVLEHETIAPWTFPYEWSFALLKAAALFHLDLHLTLLKEGLTLSDASAYNVQFVGPRPIFIDHLSIRPYVEGEYWLGHRQFCEQFLNPLLLRAVLGVSHNSWYRGALEGIPTGELAKLLPARSRLDWGALTHVILPAWFQRGETSEKSAKATLKARHLPKASLIGMLSGLRRWIDRLKPKDGGSTVWANYATTTVYDDAEQAQKRRVVERFVAEGPNGLVIDLGCNTGDYARAALVAGATRVVGFDFDQQSLDRAHARAKAETLDFLALYLDARNPSPDQGWRQRERTGFSARITADAVIALAFEHHLAIAHNVPLDEVVGWIVGLAPRALIEFVPKSDPTVQKMLALREDIFECYDEANFVAAIERVGRIEGRETVSASGRTLFAITRV